MKALLTDYPWGNLDIERETLRAAGIELVAASQSDEASLSALAADCEAIMTCWAKVTRNVIAAAPRCRLVSRLGIGLDNIDVAYATSRGIVVTNVPDYCIVEVAEHTLALLLALARKTAWYHHETKNGRYDLSAGPTMRRVAGQTLGIVGLGNIGRAVAERARAIGLQVVACSHTPKPDSDFVRMASLDELLTMSDFVSLHLPLSEPTRRMMGPAQFARMKPGAYLINTARGGLIDNEALAAALASDRLAGAALDVQEPEPPDLAIPPWNDPRVIVTPHAAFVSAEALIDLRTRASRQVATLLAGGRPENVVNPQVLS